MLLILVGLSLYIVSYNECSSSKKLKAVGKR